MTARLESANRPETDLSMGAEMAQHEHGSMNIKDQEKTFDGFVTWSIRVAIACIGVLLFLAVFAS